MKMMMTFNQQHMKKVTCVYKHTHAIYYMIMLTWLAIVCFVQSAYL